MKVTREQFAENRARILKVAAGLFREKGFDGIGIADIMQAAGLTHGGFYRHFASRDDLLAQASHMALDDADAVWNRYTDKALAQPLQTLLRRYLTEAHRDRVSEGCVFAALATDAARQGQPVRGAFTRGLRSQLAVVAELVTGRTRAARRRKALAVMAGMVGALVLARAVDDPELSREVLDAVSQELAAAA